MSKLTKSQIALDIFRDNIAKRSNGVVMVNTNGCWSIRGDAYGFPEIADSTRDAWLLKNCTPLTEDELLKRINQLKRNAARYGRAIHKFVDCGNFQDAGIACERAESCIRWIGGENSRWFRYYKLKTAETSSTDTLNQQLRDSIALTNGERYGKDGAVALGKNPEDYK